MEIRRFFAHKSNMHDNQIVLNADEHHHLKNVLRLREGFIVIVSFNDDGFDYKCRINKILKDETILDIIEIINNETKLNKNIVLYQALAKKDKTEFIAQKACELGLNSFHPFISKFSRDINNFSYERCVYISKDAAKQCGRSRYTDIDKILTFDEMLESLKKYDIVLVFYENEKEQFIENVLQRLTESENIAIVIGSEGGFDVDEILAFKELENLEIISLGKRILRCETAAVMAVSLVLFNAGEIN